MQRLTSRVTTRKSTLPIRTCLQTPISMGESTRSKRGRPSTTRNSLQLELLTAVLGLTILTHSTVRFQSILWQLLTKWKSQPRTVEEEPTEQTEWVVEGRVARPRQPQDRGISCTQCSTISSPQSSMTSLSICPRTKPI